MSTRRRPAGVVAPDLRDLELFLFHEARLLDEQRWEEWNALFTDDGVYWAPAMPEQPNATHYVSLIHENALLRAVRVKRFRHPHAFSLQPRPRTLHLVSNVMLDSVDAGGNCVVTSRFMMAQYRREKQDLFAGTYTHHLRPTSSGYRIALKKAELVNCDAPMESVLVYF
ncbi:MAG: aromatic-ring-hydroxylating dioxygenase subunit beta [Gammaproteobacteria bacterium]|nr:aromatic-ring-hydroxylating dioxygenase subunit beta [Gammaproteobacteria bacterium]